MMERELLTTDELMKKLKVTRNTLYNWRTEGGMPYKQVGRGIRYEFQAVGEWLEQQNDGGESE